MERLVDEIAEDRDTLRGFMDVVDADRDTLKVAGGWIAERWSSRRSGWPMLEEHRRRATREALGTAA
jgi:hypothetical protein